MVEAANIIILRHSAILAPVVLWGKAGEFFKHVAEGLDIIITRVIHQRGNILLALFACDFLQIIAKRMKFGPEQKENMRQAFRAR